MNGVRTNSLKKRFMKNRYTFIGILFLLPAFVGYFAFMGYPLLQTFRLSLTDWSGFGEESYIGLKNFVTMASDATFWYSLKNTLYFAVFSSLFSIVIGIFMAWLILFLRNLEGRFFRTVFFSPAMIAPTITGLLFVFIFTEDIGLLNNMLELIGLGNLTTAWLTNPNTVYQVVVIATVWRQFGLVMVLCFAGLQGIPTSLIEAARLSGANNFQILTKVMLPLIKPQIELSTMFTLVGGLKIYDSIVSLTGGGPARQTVVLPMWIVEKAFTYSQFGYACAMCVAFIFVVLLFIMAIKFVFRGESYEF